MGILSVRMTGFFSPMKILEYLNRTGKLKYFEFSNPNKTIYFKIPPCDSSTISFDSILFNISFNLE